MQLFSSLMALLCLLVAIFGVILAIQLYSLLKTGAIGQTWQIVIIAIGIYGVERILYFAQVWGFVGDFVLQPTRRALELLFIILMTVALYVQRRAFLKPHLYRYSEGQDRGYPSRFERLRQTDDLGRDDHNLLSDEDE
ncbi:MAG: hypothetical protein COZ06_16905 [Armatimonadetes bacterium CG_4_10_14_3_um_filter_66_18]|nr:hypothetical protein [Armatimonadota bacterium]OIP04208.1 MAG: hypothetical protein AUJ96_13300 [Armatimonadetes bacterium CG2_30_66_41]PIU91877.1 MAG: hypothetical protein COS65_20640 [Armatimonadetes bacterium CG06_land_8_20_14_3_00_66_21]PIY48238.1 MAG: hypothetical protein COZ06_16905 [Armatimonadetes bacterium CG_4_10_14_3_um_filter_66_18]PIZ47738.1 MAG: hypothetical protein COY42_07765 [Armatimonadetes bacterium CG_4_10_14_0_8_um_filter_66_14]PJB71139.1 MAG: hypothetical protein CO096